MNKNIIVTGANGFIGSSLAYFFLKKNYNVIGIDITENSIVNHKAYSYYKVDLLKEDLNFIDEYIDDAILIHCAGNANVGISVENPKRDFQLNVVVVNNIMDYIKQNKKSCRVVLLSSAAVYGNPKKLPIAETDDLEPISPYGLHKKFAEEICLSYSKNYNISVKIVRIFSAYGEGLRKQVFWDMYNKVKEFNKLDLYGNGRESRDFIYILDVVKAIQLISEDDSEETIFNVANGEEIYMDNIAEIFCEAIKIEKNNIKFNNIVHVGNPNNWVADISKLRRIGYNKSVSIEEGINNYVSWVKNNG